MQSRIEKLDRYLLVSVILTVLIVVGINFVTSYGHIYIEGLHYGEYGVDARLMPIGIDGMLLAIGLANVFAARFNRSHWLLRAALGFGVAGTVAANGAYGAGWGITGGLLSTWSPVALFIAVESGLFMFRVVADVMASQPVVKRGRPVGSKNGVRQTRTKTSDAQPDDSVYTGTEIAIPVIRGRVDPGDPFRDLRKTP